MRRLRSRLVGAAGAAGLACAGLAAGAGPAAATGCSGVSVVIDTGSSISTRCAPGDPSSALAALGAVAGWDPVATQPGFVCRIDGVPASDPCVRTPPATAYWAFFHAPAGGSWTYSSQGAGSYDPPAGSAIGFRFGSGQQPRTAPPAPATASTPKATTSTPRATTSAPTQSTRTTSSAPRTTSGGGTAPRTSTGGTSSTRSTSPSPSATRSSTRPSPSATGSTSAAGTPTDGTASTTAAGTPTMLAAQPTSDEESGGTGTLLVAGGLLALLAGAAGWFAWRRRSPR